jgi:hypothetical protein
VFAIACERPAFRFGLAVRHQMTASASCGHDLRLEPIERRKHKLANWCPARHPGIVLTSITRQRNQHSLLLPSRNLKDACGEDNAIEKSHRLGLSNISGNLPT